jgi:hypothetical protein
MNSSFTRRQLAAALAGALPAAAQAPAALPTTESEKAIEQLRANSKALGSHQIPMATEPAFVFKP